MFPFIIIIISGGGSRPISTDNQLGRFSGVNPNLF